jgi:hypothetical protein
LAKIADGDFRWHRHREARLLQVEAGDGDLHTDPMLDGVLRGDDVRRELRMGCGDAQAGGEHTWWKAENGSSKAKTMSSRYRSTAVPVLVVDGLQCERRAGKRQPVR